MPTAYKTNYFDPMGRSKTGYIIDGKTYKDEDGKLYYPLSTDIAVFGKDGKIYTRSGKYFTVLFEFNEE